MFVDVKKDYCFTSFKEVSIGDVVIVADDDLLVPEDRVIMKICSVVDENNLEYNAVDVETGELCYITEKAIVIVPSTSALEIIC